MDFPQGYEAWGDEPFEEMAGPFKFTQKADGDYKAAFISEQKHCNGGGFMHGGLLMTFADYTLFVIAKDHLGPKGAVTISFSSEFVAGVGPGEFIESDGSVTRATRSGLIFVTGRIYCGEKTLMTYSGVLKRID